MITTVGELGSVLAQVTPTAAAMNVQFEQVGAGLATMTAQGTPAAQATTQLNQLFAELGKKGTLAQKGLAEAAKGTKYAGMSFQDMMAAGVPLNEVLDLMGTYAGKNKKTMMDMFSSIEAGKAALANAGQNSEQFTANLQAMSTEADVVGDAYDKVMNTFEEQSKKALNSLKNLGIGIYNDLKEPLKDSVKSAGDGLDKLNKSFSSGALRGSIKDLGTQIGNVAGKLLDFAVKAIPKVVSGLSWFLKNGKLIASAIIGIKGAQLALNTATAAGNIIMPIVQKVTTAANLAQRAYAAGCTLSTSAQIGLSAALAGTQVQMALVTGGLTLLIGGIAMLVMNSMAAEDATNELTEAANEQRQAWEDLKKSHEEQMISATAEIDNTIRYKNELDHLIDSEGNVIGNKERVKFLIDQINAVLPGSIKLINDETVAYQTNSAEIDKQLEKKKAVMMLEVVQAQAKESLATRTKALDEAEQLYAENQERRTKIKEMEIEREQEMERARTTFSFSARQRATELGHQIEQEKALLADADTARTENVRIATECMDSIAQREEMQSLIEQGHYDEAIARYYGKVDAFKITSDMTKEEMDKQVNDLGAAYQRMLLEQQTGDKNITDSMLSEARQRWLDASLVAAAGGQSATLAGCNGIESASPELRKTMVDAWVKNLKDAGADQATLREAKAVGEAIINGTSNGLTSNQKSLYSKIIGVMNGALMAAKAALGIASPSRKFRDLVGKQMMAGIPVGADLERPNVEKSLRKNMSRLTSEAEKQVKRNQYRWTHPISLQANYNARFGRPQWLNNQNDNRVNQTLIFNKEVDSPAEMARKVRYVGQMLAYRT